MRGDYTVEVYKADGRCKSGWKFYTKRDYINMEKSTLEEAYSDKYLILDKKNRRMYKYTIHDTWVTRKNLLTGEPFLERYDTPYYCSPSSETFWSS